MSVALNAFLEIWTNDVNDVKPLFTAMRDFLQSCDQVELDFKSRPGVSHSLRARHIAQKTRPLFVLVDIIDDDPEARWLSVCLYADLAEDPEGRGDVVPGGLFGEDACCFDIESSESQVYMLERLREACANAARSE